MKKFTLRFNHFNKMYWKKAEQNKPRLLTNSLKGRRMGKTMMTQVCIEYICNNYGIYHKRFITRFKKIDNWRNKHRRKGL